MTIYFVKAEMEIIENEVAQALRGIHKSEYKCKHRTYCPKYHYTNETWATIAQSVLKKVRNELED